MLGERGIVVVADDDRAIRELAQKTLEHHGFLVLPARDGEEALARMQSISEKALAVVDLWMPGMNGLQLIRFMRSAPALRQIPVIVMTADVRAQVPDAQRVLYKPFRIPELVKAARELCVCCDAAWRDLSLVPLPATEILQALPDEPHSPHDAPRALAAAV